MRAIEVENLKFKYHTMKEYAVQIDHFFVDIGETILVTGKSGSGKSTFINVLNGLIPDVIGGKLEGNVRIMGEDISGKRVSDVSRLVSTLFQDPERQVMNYQIMDEIAFGPENLNLPREEIKRRLDRAIEIVGIEEYLGRETTKLSGGELQRVALASVISMEAPILIMDEPTSNIDPEGTKKIFDFVHRNKSASTQIIVEHKVERTLPFVDRIVVIEHGKIILDIPKEKLLENVETLVNAGIEVPEEYIYAKKIGTENLDPTYIASELAKRGISLSRRERKNDGLKTLELNLQVEVEKKQIVKTELHLKKGQVYCLMGKNGAGKTTTINGIMAFLDKRNFKYESKLIIDGENLTKKDYGSRGRKIAYLPQSFDLMLISKTVQDELYFSWKHRKDKNGKEKAERMIKIFSLDDKRNRDPLMLSTGQRRRVCMASALASNAEILLMDEPTSGQDFYHKKIMGEEIRQLSSLGFSFIIVTHDSRFAYRYSDMIGIMQDGKIVAEGEPDQIFKESGKYGIIAPSDFDLRCDEVVTSV